LPGYMRNDGRPREKTFHCSNCNYLVFFENVRCERCNVPLGFIPEIADLSAFDVDAARLWRRKPSPLGATAAANRKVSR